MNKIENLNKTKISATQKRLSLLEQNSLIEEKIEKLQKQKEINVEKIKRIDFFLNKTEESIKNLQNSKL